MGLFAKRPILDSNAPLYSLGLSATILIVGLGNPGEEYDKTHHNIGFMVLNNFANKQGFDKWITKKICTAFKPVTRLVPQGLFCANQQLFMNESGHAVQAMQHFYKIDIAKTLVVYDELDINFGQIRTRMGGSDAGHNGVKSISNECGEQYGRIRIGIGPKKPVEMTTSDFVLAKFSHAHQKQMPLLLQEANAVLSEFVYNPNELVTETRSFII